MAKNKGGITFWGSSMGEGGGEWSTTGDWDINPIIINGFQSVIFLRCSRLKGGGLSRLEGGLKFFLSSILSKNFFFQLTFSSIFSDICGPNLLFLCLFFSPPPPLQISNGASLRSFRPQCDSMLCLVSWSFQRSLIPSGQKNLWHCWLNAGPPSTTLAQQ